MWGCVIRFWTMGTCILSLVRKALPFLSGFGEARGPQSLARALIKFIMKKQSRKCFGSCRWALAVVLIKIQR